MSTEALSRGALGLGDHVADQPLSTFHSLQNDHSLLGSGCAQGGFDLSQLDTITAKLDLRVRPPQKLQLPIFPPARQVPRGIHLPLLLRPDLVRPELFRREGGEAEVPPGDEGSAEEHLAGDQHSSWHVGVLAGVQDPPCHGHTNGDLSWQRLPLRALPHRHFPLRGTVQIVQLPPREGSEVPLGHRRGQGLAAGENVAQGDVGYVLLFQPDVVQH
mmetsp:Transcript_29557/g.75781  ORF Transcript_29557/g.75781 Transcript_29557/m.75781 type:complete len:216 (+) Transcript_29557:2859-3506(+)